MARVPKHASSRARPRCRWGRRRDHSSRGGIGQHGPRKDNRPKLGPVTQPGTRGQRGQLTENLAFMRVCGGLGYGGETGTGRGQRGQRARERRENFSLQGVFCLCAVLPQAWPVPMRWCCALSGCCAGDLATWPASRRNRPAVAPVPPRGHLAAGSERCRARGGRAHLAEIETRSACARACSSPGRRGAVTLDRRGVDQACEGGEGGRNLYRKKHQDRAG